jgi:hypothetical protein
VPGNTFDDEERPTLIPCASCGGRYKVNDHECPWCTSGAMSDAQLQAWKAHRLQTRGQGR